MARIAGRNKIYREQKENTARAVPDFAVVVLLGLVAWWLFASGSRVEVKAPVSAPIAKAAASLPQGVSARDRDLMILTVIGEAEHEPRLGQIAVAHVILNRWRKNTYGWKSISEVVLAKKQYEPWMVRKNTLLKIRPFKPAYIQAASVVDDVLSGRVDDPTNGAYYFLNVAVVKKRGMSREWKRIIAQPECLDIGHHKFCPLG